MSSSPTVVTLVSLVTSLKSIRNVVMHASIKVIQLCWIMLSELIWICFRSILGFEPCGHITSERSLAMKLTNLNKLCLCLRQCECVLSKADQTGCECIFWVRSGLWFIPFKFCRLTINVWGCSLRGKAVQAVRNMKKTATLLLLRVENAIFPFSKGKELVEYQRLVYSCYIHCML